jgi:hypothetical protein
MNKGSTLVIAVLLIVIALLTWLLIGKKVEAPTVTGESTTTENTNTTGATGGSTSPSAKPLHERVVVTSPKANESVPKKFTITGKAPGNWFFEASAPFMVLAEDGSKIAQGITTAQGEWMTTELVDFKAEVSINPAYSGSATLVLLKDNPSGLPENDDSLEIPIVVQ